MGFKAYVDKFKITNLTYFHWQYRAKIFTEPRILCLLDVLEVAQWSRHLSETLETWNPGV